MLNICRIALSVFLNFTADSVSRCPFIAYFGQILVPTACRYGFPWGPAVEVAQGAAPAAVFLRDDAVRELIAKLGVDASDNYLSKVSRK